jgi:hypothetical protein
LLLFQFVYTLRWFVVALTVFALDF